MLEALQFNTHTAAKVVKLKTHLMSSALSVSNVGLQLVHLISLGSALTHELVQSTATFRKIAVGIVECLP